MPVPNQPQVEAFNFITIVLAVTGTVLSLVALAWNIFRDLNDKGKLNVQAMVGTTVFPTGDIGKDLLHITITNVGRRPLGVQGVGGRQLPKTGQHKGYFTIWPKNLPKVLSEGQSVSEDTEDLTVVSENLLTIFAVDSNGKRWKISKKNRNKLLRDKEELDGNKQKTA